MKLAIFNGSPRGAKSNSGILVQEFLKGFFVKRQQEVPIHYIAKINDLQKGVQMFEASDTCLIIFPLYTDSMPGIVKEFMEQLVASPGCVGKKLGFIVQSGFPEAVHSVYVEKYLEQLCQRLQSEYLGTVIKGGVEGIQIMPPAMTRKLFKNFFQLGTYFAEHNAFCPTTTVKLAKPYRMSGVRRFFFRIFAALGFTNFYWDSNLKKNKAFHKRFDRPYQG